jgi:thymidine kinase
MSVVNPMKDLHANAGKLELIIGPMYSGKSSSLIHRIRQYRVIGQKVLVINHSCNTRYTDASVVSSHDKVTIDAVNCERLMPLLVDAKNTDVNVICIEEAQFFEDLYEFVMLCVEQHGKHIIVSGLDGDFNRKPFRQVLDLIPLSDIVERRNALCITCRDGTLASFSKRIVNVSDRVLVGSDDAYIPVCRYHYHNEK